MCSRLYIDPLFLSFLLAFDEMSQNIFNTGLRSEMAVFWGYGAVWTHRSLPTFPLSGR